MELFAQQHIALLIKTVGYIGLFLMVFAE